MTSDNQWAYDLDKIIYSIVSARAKEQLVAKYPTLFVTDEEETSSNPQFPTVYIHSLSSVEEGADLDGQTINAVRATVQVKVSTNKDSSDAREVMSAIADIFKTMRFKAIAMPEIKTSGGIYRSDARFRRIIGANDTLT